MDDPGFKSLAFFEFSTRDAAILWLWMSLDSGDLVHLCELE